MLIGTVAVCVIFLVPATIACLYYVVFSLLARSFRERGERSSPARTFAVVIPACNEEVTLPNTLKSVFALDYPPEMVRVYVVADNCTDQTSAVARDAGVMCLVRNDAIHRGKGFALEFGLEAVVADAPDVVLILDADCELNSGALRALDAVFAAGAEAAQLAVCSANPDSGPAGYVAAVGDAVADRVAGGLDRLGLSVPLRGTGMAFRLDTLERVPWAAFSATEDAEYAARLRLAGIRVRLVADGCVSCSAPPRLNDLCRQRRRWLVSLLAGGAMGLPSRAVRSKPLVLAHLLFTVTAAFVLGEASLVVWSLVLVALTASVYMRAVVAVGLSWRRVGLLCTAPVVVARLAWLTGAGLVRRRRVGWDDTHARVRPADTARIAAVPQEIQFARRPIWLRQFLHSPFVQTRNTRAPGVSLTFDDGPHPTHTPAVLDRLKQYGVRATFFLIGERIASAPRLPGMISGAGHRLGNHTLSHPRFGALAFARPFHELKLCQELIPQANAFRPPFGRLTPGVLLAAWRVGLPVVTWSVDSGDWQCQTESEATTCAWQVLEMVRPGDIVLLHDDRPFIELILDILLPGLARRGLLDAMDAIAPKPTRIRSTRRSVGRTV
jgi:peptidoglycan/xylan/chitin deacetylase (PgdA/CDA1 family)